MAGAFCCSVAQRKLSKVMVGVYTLAEDALAANGWRRTSDWDDASGDAAYATVERA